MNETRLEFTEGTSSKFWHARQDGATLTVTFGRIGTAGQTQEKTFGSEDEAKRAFEKQVAEKRKKGYTDDASAAPESAPPPAPAPVPVPVSTTPGRQLRLKPSDYPAGAPLAPRVALAPPPTRPFDRDDCIARLLQVVGNETYMGSWHWGKADVTRAISREEAHFWLNLLTATFPGKIVTPPKIEAWARGWVCDGNLPLADLLQAAGKLHYGYPEQVVFPVFVLFGVSGILDFVEAFANSWSAHVAIHGIENRLLPALTQTEADELRERLIAFIHAKVEPPMWAMRLTAKLAGAEETLRQIVARWPDGSGRPQYFGGYGGNQGNEWLRVALGLGDPEIVAAEAHRLDALPMNGDDARALLAVTQFRAVDLIARSAIAQTAKKEAETLASALALAEGPETAPAMLDVFLDSKAPRIARDWLETFPAFAIDGLAPLLTGAGKRADAARDLLRGLKKQGHGELLAHQAESLPEPVAAALQAQVLDHEEIVHPELSESDAPDWVRQIFGGGLNIPDLPADENPPRRLNLTDADYARLQPAPLPEPIPRPAPPPFDLEDCIARLNRMGDPQEATWKWKWEKTEVGVSLERREAHFWNEALKFAHDDSRHTLATTEARLRTLSFTGEVRQKELMLPLRTGAFAGVALRVAWSLYGMEGLLRGLASGTHWPVGMVEVCERYVLPWLTESERADLLQRLTNKVRQQETPENWALLLGARLGMPVETLRESIARWKDVEGTGWHWTRNLLPLLLHLGDPEIIAHEARRLRAYPDSAAEARALLAATDAKALDVLADAIANTWQDKTELARVLLAVEAPEVAPHALALKRLPSLKTMARDWLDRNPTFAIEGLAPIARQRGKEADAAREHLKEMARRGWRWLIQKKIPDLAPQITAARAAKPTPADARLAALLPPLLVQTTAGTRRLTDAQRAQVIAWLRTTPLIEPSPELALLKANAQRAALDHFVWQLFDGWLTDGGPGKERWKMEALGHLGGDAIALRLTPLIRNWPGESQHPRAVTGLDILRAIATDTALMQLHGIAQKLPFKALKQRAAECLDAIAADRGLSTEELADRIIPDGGLDENGGRTFDFGSRQFTFVLSGDLKPLVRDGSGKRLPDLPKPTQKDDAAMASAALAEWKLLKKQVAQVAKTQALRLEQAMVLGRRWSPSEFSQLFVSHPLMIHLVRRLVWCAYDEAGQPIASFRVCEDNTLADVEDTLWELPATATHVGIVHPSHLSVGDRGRWGEILSDYEIIAPFVQLGRTIHTLIDAERTSRHLSRFAGVKVDPKTLVFGLEALGWQRGQPQDGGSFASHYKDFDSLYALVTYADGVWVGSNGDDWDDQVMESVGFLRDRNRAADGWFSESEFESIGVPLGAIDPVIVSEVLYDVTRLVEKGRK